MSTVLSKAGLVSLRGPILSFGAMIAAAAAIAASGYFYLQFEKRDDRSSEKSLVQAKARLEAARKEQEDMRTSAETFRILRDRGVLNEELRIDLIEMVDRLKAEYHIAELDYEVSPQRPVQLPGNRAFKAIEVLASRVKFRVQAVHDGDLLGFIDELARHPRSFFNLERCLIKRVEAGALGPLQPRVEAECSLEWITVRDKRIAKAKGP
jgi:hypothetical protein